MPIVLGCKVELRLRKEWHKMTYGDQKSQMESSGYINDITTQIQIKCI